MLGQVLSVAGSIGTTIASSMIVDGILSFGMEAWDKRSMKKEMAGTKTAGGKDYKDTKSAQRTKTKKARASLDAKKSVRWKSVRALPKKAAVKLGKGTGSYLKKIAKGDKKMLLAILAYQAGTQLWDYYNPDLKPSEAEKNPATGTLTKDEENELIKEDVKGHAFREGVNKALKEDHDKILNQNILKRLSRAAEMGPNLSDVDMDNTLREVESLLYEQQNRTLDSLVTGVISGNYGTYNENRAKGDSIKGLLRKSNSLVNIIGNSESSPKEIAVARDNLKLIRHNISSVAATDVTLSKIMESVGAYYSQQNAAFLNTIKQQESIRKGGKKSSSDKGMNASLMNSYMRIKAAQLDYEKDSDEWLMHEEAANVVRVELFGEKGDSVFGAKTKTLRDATLNKG